MIQAKLILKFENFIFYLLILFLPTQLGKHFWTDFSIVSGLRVDYLSPTLYLTDVLIGLLFLIWLLNRQSGKCSASKIFLIAAARDSGQARMTFAFFFFLIFNIIFSGNFLNGFYHLFKLIELSFVGFYVATQIKELKYLQKIILLLAAATIGESLLTIVQFVKQSSVGGLFYLLGERAFSSSTPGIANASINGELMLRPYATFPHPNVLAGFLVITMILSIGFFKTYKNNLHKLLIILSLFLGTSALVLTMSRIAIILWILIILFFLFKQRLFGKKRITLFIFTLFIFTLVITPFGTRLLSTHLTEESVVQREALINSSFKLFTSHPIVGVGFGNFLPSLPSVQKPFSPTFYIQPVHNIFILVLVETGVIGFSFLIWFLVKTYRHLFKSLKTHKVFFVALTAVLILGIFDHYFLTLQQGQLLLFTTLGLCWVCFAHRD